MIQNEKGFTIIELVVVIAIIGITFGIANISLSSIVNAKIEKYGNEFAMILRLTRFSQMSHTDTYKLNIEYDKVNNKYTIKQKVNDITKKEIKLKKGYEIYFNNGIINNKINQDFEILFTKSSGSVEGTIGGNKDTLSGTYIFKLKDSTKEVKVTLQKITGRVTVE